MEAKRSHVRVVGAPDDDNDDDVAQAKLSKLTVDDTRYAHPKDDAKHSDDGDGDSDGAVRVAERKLDLEVEREWKQARLDTGPGRIAVANNPRAKKIARGLVINHMNMRCADTGKLLWQSSEWTCMMMMMISAARIPAAILKCSAVSREINFTSKEEITQFRLEQRVFLGDCCIEEWLFTFGFVIPGSTNSWQQTIEGAGADAMLDPDVVSGKLTIETAFYDGQQPIAKTVYRIYYV
ncbi:TPA: hypothetical protein N0F65_004288 [Lagenidium giganteum]|uniref:GMP phosphodiesterase delta subunit domain-containing protein n=1 Tax=Lagenidium giganteum TaxID=4803 RepID=A0AAV2ZDX3_9STRA|nr:TPA: hypothetical protein N0F65_004288 [Lagenidium giganteum]